MYQHQRHSPGTGNEIHHWNIFNFPLLPIPVNKSPEGCLRGISRRFLSDALLFSRHSHVNTGHMPVCQHSYLKNSKSAPVSQYQLWMSLHKRACLPAGKTENPRAANPAHLHPEQKTKQISFNPAWEIIMENKTKSTQTFQSQGNLATCFALGKLHNNTQIGTFPTEENQRPKGLWTTAVTVLNTKSK